MEIAQQQPFGALPSFEFTFSPGRKSTQPVNTPTESTVLNDGTGRLGASPLVNTGQSIRETSSFGRQPPSSDQARTPPLSQDDLDERIKLIAERIMNAHIAAVLSPLAEDCNLLERGLVNHFDTRIEMLRASAVDHCDKKLHEMEITISGGLR